ncbi:MAG: PadR family transcriptional regulator [Gemmatimonadetes bacterium]|nr:PadR family transcriptional regulator [Gemmatimonadota bacterium]
MKEATEFLPLTAPVFHILLALADDERHGYAILQEVERRSNGSVSLGTGTLYTAIKRMLDWGIIEKAESRLDPGLDDDRRRYYRITPLGQQVARAEAARMDSLVGLARDKQVL